MPGVAARECAESQGARDTLVGSGGQWIERQGYELDSIDRPTPTARANGVT